MAQLKGFAILGLLRFARQGGLDPRDVVRRLPEPARASFEHPIVHGAYYPYEAYSSLLAEIAARLTPSRPNVMREYGHVAAHQDLQGIFRVVTFITRPESAARRAGVFWSRYCDTGRLVNEEARPGYLRSAIVGFRDIHPLHCRAIEGWVEGLSEAWGTEEARCEQTECVRAGASRCLFEATWKA